MIQSMNPATGQVVETFDEWSEDQTRGALDDVAAAWKPWSATSLSERAAILRRTAEILREKRVELADLMALEMGKPVTQGRLEIDKSALVCDHYADNAGHYLAPEPVDGVGSKAFVSYEPLGTVLAVMPWNFPFWQVFRIAAPSLMAGNAMVLKHASNVPQCALSIERVLAQAGLPHNVFRTLMIGAGQVENVLAHDSVAGVCLTGSDAAGRNVASLAGRHLKRSVMELGGSDPFVVLEDADLDKAVQVAVCSRCKNTGQACIAAKRFIVMDSVYDEFVARMKKGMEALRVGDPADPETYMGPMATETLRAELQDQVDRCIAAGGTLVLGGGIPDGPGAFYPPTIITDVPSHAPVAQEELFGPVALVFKVFCEQEAIDLANATPYGLGGSVWTSDREKGLEMAARIKAGSVFVNALVSSTPLLPFGGIKASGYGRELAAWGIREFVNVKTTVAG
ncbi:NAD-dependent succinate-semialdehyde dehydrogenase [Salidesulfovibrio onnuriiensis]|uniref:NAD-dependent succinate-semialdehyde dehydrogenase n=1 Tax=Salidesulfovibrio onnuriiensis TaxID=2583823 RepID=UPI0011C8A26B|nr:NAD-dependent succinate-semialdehyde dehydrogenase [Salidesulfovibrio onnuriiensis]